MNYVEKIKKNFNKAFETYAKHSSMQMTIGMKLVNFTKSYAKYHNTIIDLGCGNTELTLELAKALQHNFLHFHAIDIAEKLLFKSQLPPTIKRYLHDFNDSIPQHFDLVFANMSLQWALNLQKTFELIYKSLNNNGCFVMSIPMKNSLSELKKYVGINYFYAHSDIVCMLKNSHFEIEMIETEMIKQSFANTMQTLRSLKLIGANTTFTEHRGLRGKNFFSRLTISELIYEIGYFVVRKK